MSNFLSCVEHMGIFTQLVNGVYYWVCTCNKTCCDSCQMIWFETMVVYLASASRWTVNGTVSRELRPF